MYAKSPAHRTRPIGLAALHRLRQSQEHPLGSTLHRFFARLGTCPGVRTLAPWTHVWQKSYRLSQPIKAVMGVRINVQIYRRPVRSRATGDLLAVSRGGPIVESAGLDQHRRGWRPALANELKAARVEGNGCPELRTPGLRPGAFGESAFNAVLAPCDQP